MRYQDWDVLLFPAGDDAAQVPFKEFRTQCHIEPRDNINAGPAHATPVLTSFIPSISHLAPFQISIHSWTKVKSIFHPSSVAKPKELFHVEVIIDGKLACTETFSIDVNWPQIISSSNPFGENGVSQPLRFPHFHKDMRYVETWDAAEHRGRIRVEVSVGYEKEEKSNCFVKVSNVVNFAFQYAPLGALESCGIAWPRPSLFTYAGQAAMVNANRNYTAALNSNHLAAMQPAFNEGSVAAPITSYPQKHLKRASASNINLATSSNAFFGVPTSSSLNPYTQDQHSNYDGASRSTSAYSNMPDSAAPLLQKIPIASGYPLTQSSLTQAPPNQDSFPIADHVQQNQPVRLSSDQLHMIINALKPATTQDEQKIDTGASMPPPPLPAHAGSNPVTSPFNQRAMSMGVNTLPHFGTNPYDRRGDSRYSDVSMHADCDGFPTCTSEDAEGHIVHNGPNAPLTVVRGRKEGSSPTKPRDFLSTILDSTTMAPAPTAPRSMAATEEMVAEQMGLTSSSPADAHGKKRTRSALRQLNINDGSPEKKAVSKPRKVTRASVSSSASNKENDVDFIDD